MMGPTRASGGIGRRAGFRFLCPKGCAGSSPASPTRPPAPIHSCRLGAPCSKVTRFRQSLFTDGSGRPEGAALALHVRLGLASPASSTCRTRGGADQFVARSGGDAVRCSNQARAPSVTSCHTTGVNPAWSSRRPICSGVSRNLMRESAAQGTGKWMVTLRRQRRRGRRSGFLARAGGRPPVHVSFLGDVHRNVLGLAEQTEG